MASRRKNNKISIRDLLAGIDAEQLGHEMHRMVAELYPICRSITGNGVRETLAKMKKSIPLTVHEVSSGTKVFDWTVPREWNIRDAYIKDSTGHKVVDYRNTNLHVLNYSIPVNRRVELEELKVHLFTVPEHQDWIPYRTSYYNENWGFCLSHKQFLELKEEIYEVVIESSLQEGSLTYGELLVRGQISDEILISTHICHPSLCNDNLSGIVLATYLADLLSKTNVRYSYRFLFIPGTIGSITWLALNEKRSSKIRHGLVVACVGDAGKFNYKKSRLGSAEIDRAAVNALKSSGKEFNVIEFFPFGYDERQYCSPGFNLPVGCLMRTPHGEFPEYHTSADNLELVKPLCLGESLEMYLNIFSVLENNETYVSTNQKCEPQLGKRGLYQHIGGHPNSRTFQLALLWVLNMSDGSHSLLDIAEKSGLTFNLISDAANLLSAKGLLLKI